MPCLTLLFPSLGPHPLAETHGQRARGAFDVTNPGPPFRAGNRAEKGGRWAWRGRQKHQACTTVQPL